MVKKTFILGILFSLAIFLCYYLFRQTPKATRPGNSEQIFQVLQNLLTKNRMAVEEKVTIQSEYFSKHEHDQKPKYFWIGCSDSRVNPEQILGLGIGDVFVHRNIANQVNPNDESIIAALEFAINYLKIQHIIVAGHTNCGGIKAASTDQDFGHLEPWLEQIRDIKLKYDSELESLPIEERFSRLIRLNVREQMNRIASIGLVKEHWEKGGKLAIHGVLYHLKSGIVEDIGHTIEGLEGQNVEM